MIAQRRPLSVLITRSKEGNDELAKKLKLQGLEPIAVDTISTSPPANWDSVDHVLMSLDSYHWLVLTSPTGVEYFGERMRVLSLHVPWAGRPKVAAVGERTALSLSRMGVKVDFVPSAYTTRTLGNELPAAAGERILLLRSDIADPRLREVLAGRSFQVDEAPIYRTLPVNEPVPRVSDADIIIFASPSAVKSFCSLVDEEGLGTLRGRKAVCIGPVTESAARDEGFADTCHPESFTIDGVVEEIARLSRAIA